MLISLLEKFKCVGNLAVTVQSKIYCEIEIALVKEQPSGCRVLSQT